jgi:hypothetical protein
VQKGTDLHPSVLLSLAANTSLLSGTSHVIFLLRSREHQRQDRGSVTSGEDNGGLVSQWVMFVCIHGHPGVPM